MENFKNVTLGIIKPGAMNDKKGAAILDMLNEQTCLTRIAMRQVNKLPMEFVRRFYIELKDAPFFDELCTFMSDKVILFILAGENAVNRYREILGATDPADAEDETIRKQYGTSKGHNAAHGSDSDKNALREIALCCIQGVFELKGFTSQLDSSLKSSLMVEIQKQEETINL